MMKIQIPINLSQQSIQEAKEKVQQYKNSLEKGYKNGIKKATELMYERVVYYCQQANIVNDINDIHMEYDEQKNEGRVWASNSVIIFNEMGTGITGANNSHPSPSDSFKSWKYDVNEHGEKGWIYPKKDGTFGWTKGLPSKHMFYDAFNDIKDELKDYINVEIDKTVGDLY